MDLKVLRNAFGRAPTGVAVISTTDQQGLPVAMTANSVVPVGTDSIHMFWSLGKQSRSRPTFEAAQAFGVSLLAEDQLWIARQMASSVVDRFDGITWRWGTSERVPLITGSIALFECVKIETFEIGDHVSFIGAVTECQCYEGNPLLYVDGQYSRLADRALPVRMGKGVALCS